MRFTNNPPTVAIVGPGGVPSGEMYKWMASVTRMTGVIEGPFQSGQFLTLAAHGDLQTERVFTPASGQLTGTDAGAGSTYTLGLANTAVAAGSYGGAGSLVSFTVDAKGRLTAAASVAGADMSKTDDTNVTLTLGGSPVGSLLKATSLTLGWTGTLAVARGGTGGGAASGTLLDNITGFASTGQIVRTGAGAYAFRTLTAGSAKVAVTNGSGVAGNPTVDLGSVASTDLSDVSAGACTLTITDSAGNSATMGANNYARYARIGSLVVVSGTLDWSSTAALTAGSRIRITGLPVAANATSNYRAAAVFGSSSAGSFNITRGEIAFGVDGGNTFVWGTKVSGNNVDGDMVKADIGNAGTLYGFTLSYHA